LQAIPEGEAIGTGAGAPSHAASTAVPATAEGGSPAVTSPDATSPVTEVSEVPQQNAQSAATGPEESSSGMSAHETNA